MREENIEWCEEAFITLLFVEPYRLHTYWEINPEDLKKLWEKSGFKLENNDFALRVHEVSGHEFDNHRTYNHFDITIDKDARNRYINLWSTGNSYWVELGIKTDTDLFYPLACSNLVNTPRLEPSDRVEERWMEVNNNPDEISLHPEGYTKEIIDNNKNKGYISYGMNYNEEPYMLYKKLLKIADAFSAEDKMNLAKRLNTLLNNSRSNSIIYSIWESFKYRQGLALSSITLIQDYTQI